MAEVALLQKEVTRAQVKHALAANKVVRKVKAYGQGVGLYFPRLRPPVCLTCIHDAGGTKRETSYAQEGMLVVPKEDRSIRVDGQDLLHIDDYQVIGGFCHILYGTSRTARRTGVSTSMKETVCVVGGKGICQLINIRFTEVLGAGLVLPLYRSPSLMELLRVQEFGEFIFPADDFTDCGDLWELMPGRRGVPQDRHQRLYALSLREDRMLGKIRRAILVPTELMAADALTKAMVSPQLMNLLTSGFFFMVYVGPKVIKVRIRPKNFKYTEQDLMELDG